MDIAAANEQLLYREDGFRQDTYFYHSGDGYYYHYSYNSPSTVYFICATSTCHGRAKWRYGSALEQTQLHNHAPDPLRALTRGLRANIVNQARSMTHISFSEIIRQERSRNANRQIRSRLTYRGLRSSMQRSRNGVFPRIPSNLRELTAIHQNPAWAHLTRTTDLQDFIYSGSVDSLDGSHSVIYCSERNLQHLREVPVMFADGTFYISPSIDNCYQVFTIVCVYGHTVIPLLWCLMERKTEAAYVSVLVHLRIRLGHWNFTQVICDFEDAIMNAFRRVFDVVVQGCFFHYVSDIGKWVRSNVPHFLLRIFIDLVDIIGCCCALPLLPSNLLQQGFNAIVRTAMQLGPFLFPIILPFLLYVQTSWIHHTNRGQSLTVCGSVHRTNNASESNNKRMNEQVRRAHPNVFHLINVFVEIEDATVDDLNSLNQGLIPNRHRSCSSISNDENIIALTNQLLQYPLPSDEQIMTFLHSASFSVDSVIQEALDLEYDEVVV